MTIVQPTLKRVILIWLSITWRALMWGVGFALAASVALAVLAIAAGYSQEDIKVMAQIVGPVIGLPTSLYAAYAQLGRKCGDVRLVLVSAD